MDIINKNLDNGIYKDFLSDIDELQLKSVTKLFRNICNYYGIESNNNKKIKIRATCNWLNRQQLFNYLKKFSKNGNGSWDHITLVYDNDIKPDYYVVINAPHPFDVNDLVPSKTIVFQMEPNMDKNDYWGYWKNPDPKKYLKVFTHSNSYNNLEWHLSKTYKELLSYEIKKTKHNEISTILSNKYYDPGHKLRIDFVKFSENSVCFDVYGSNSFNYKNFNGDLPIYSKDNGLIPYKYTFNAENHKIDNYFTEKIVDAILSECLCFYWGCDNIDKYIDSKAYVKLDLTNFEESLCIVKKAIEEDWWSQRIDIIRAEKKKIMEELQFFPRINNFFKNLDGNK